MTMLTPNAIAMMVDAELRATRATLDRTYEKLEATLQRGHARVAAELARWERITAGAEAVREFRA